jgi:hypothetical protein
MELFLNFLWVLMAVFGLSVWRICWAPRRSGRREPLHEWTAIVAALVFLFFAVSLSDDLHSNLVLFEESANGRRQIIGLAAPHATPQGVKEIGAAAVAVLPFLASFHLQKIGYVDPFKKTSRALLESNRQLGRAPPSLAL